MVAMGALFLLSSSEGRGDTALLTETDVQGFLSDFGWAIRRCDAEWHEAHILPLAQLTFEVKGEPPVTVGREEYLEDFRKNCYHTYISFNARKCSVSVAGSRATVLGRWERGEEVQFFFLQRREIEWVEQTLMLVRYDGGIAIERLHSIEMPAVDPDEAQDATETLPAWYPPSIE